MIQFLIWFLLVTLTAVVAVAYATWRFGPQVLQELVDGFMSGVLKGWKR